eukprot:Skav211480  [mRNA]  locus=scaffold2188:38232:41994:- [translate_table: standard]
MDFLPLLLAVGKCHWCFVLLSTDLPNLERQSCRNRYLLETLNPDLVVVGSNQEENWPAVPMITLEALTSSGCCLAPAPDFPADASAELMAVMCTGGSALAGGESAGRDA